MAKQFSISATARSTAPRHEVFTYLADSATWSAWTPFSAVTVLEPAPGGGEGVGAVKQTRYRGMSGRERIVAFEPDSRLSYVYEKGVFTPYLRDYVGVVDLSDDGDGTAIHWHSTYTARFPGSGWMPQRTLPAFLQKCADGLASAPLRARTR
jgi:uncharacterized protein YndB with AHSA1/START domain